MGKMKDDIYERIEGRMDVLQNMLETQQHISNPASVIDQIASITTYWSIMSDEDQDYISCARWAIENQKEWNI